MDILSYRAADRNSILNYSLAPESLAFTRTPREALAYGRGRHGYYPYLCLADKQLVGFFVLDAGADKYRYTADSSGLLLRSFSVADPYRGKGYAKAILKQIPDFIAENFPQFKTVVLGVNKQNKIAVNLYRNHGFSETGRTYVNTKGRQLIMEMHLQ